MDLAQVLSYLSPDAEWLLDGNHYVDLVWFGPGLVPTEQQCVDAWPAVKHAQALADVQQLRHSAYVLESDPLFFGWQRGENTEVVWLAKVQEIRSRYPEPADA